MTTIWALLARAEQYFPANPAIVFLFGDLPLTWAGFVTRTRRPLGALRSLGVEAGDHLALQCRADPRSHCARPVAFACSYQVAPLG